MWVPHFTGFNPLTPWVRDELKIIIYEDDFMTNFVSEFLGETFPTAVSTDLSWIYYIIIPLYVMRIRIIIQYYDIDIIIQIYYFNIGTII